MTKKFLRRKRTMPIECILTGPWLAPRVSLVRFPRWTAACFRKATAMLPQLRTGPDAKPCQNWTGRDSRSCNHACNLEVHCVLSRYRTTHLRKHASSLRNRGLGVRIPPGVLDLRQFKLASGQNSGQNTSHLQLKKPQRAATR